MNEKVNKDNSLKIPNFVSRGLIEAFVNSELKCRNAFAWANGNTR